MPKSFNTIKRYFSDEEKFEDALVEYNCDFINHIEPIYIYPEGYIKYIEEEKDRDIEITQFIFETEMNGDKDEIERLVFHRIISTKDILNVFSIL